jgi:carbonic anhydrase
MWHCKNNFSRANVARKAKLTHQTNQQVVGDELINDFSGRAVSHFDGHTITTDSVDSYFDWSGATFRLDQFNFHTPAEHTIDGMIRNTCT